MSPEYNTSEYDGIPDYEYFGYTLETEIYKL